jgi:arginyl-tRNA--protein-N-Asp/Glu arginylyltransferase
MTMDIKMKEFVLFQNRRKVINLYKNFLILLEDLKEDGYNISDEKYQRLRKKVLDSGNDSIRQFEEELNNIDLQ